MDSVQASTLCADKYEFGDKLGEGAFSVIVAAQPKVTEYDKMKQHCAIKVIKKSSLSLKGEEALKNEIRLLQGLHHPQIIELYEVFHEVNHHYLVFEKLNGGSLYDRLCEKIAFDERTGKELCKKLFAAIKHCHDIRIAHRDLKPDNILLTSVKSDTDVKLADFGFAKKALTPNCLATQCGTPHYAAPEVIKGELYGMQADMWSLGVITYVILGGYAPFDDEDEGILYQKILGGAFKFHKTFWFNISKDAKNFIQKLLSVDSSIRMDAAEAVQHKWIYKKSVFRRTSSLF